MSLLNANYIRISGVTTPEAANGVYYKSSTTGWTKFGDSTTLFSRSTVSPGVWSWAWLGSTNLIFQAGPNSAVEQFPLTQTAPGGSGWFSMSGGVLGASFAAVEIAVVEISTVAELQAVNTSNTTRALSYIQVDDIDAASAATWNSNAGFIPIGASATPFSGTYDGAGFSISNLPINRSTTNQQGLFGFIHKVSEQSPILRNITLINPSIIAQTQSGALVGRVEVASDALIENCNVLLEDEAEVYIEGTNGVGGFIGTSFDCVIKNCRCTLNVVGRNTASQSNIGGFIGNMGQGSIAEDCIAEGAVTARNSTRKRTGGFAGQIAGLVRRCYATGNVQGEESTGGFLGAFSNAADRDPGSCEDCYATGNVLSPNNANAVGGFCGSVRIDDNVAGISPIKRCYSIGSVTSSGSQVGGFIGGLLSGTPEGYDISAENCYWDTQTSGQASSYLSGDGVTGKTTSQMKDSKTYTGWNFTTLWDIEDSYPFLNVRAAIGMPEEIQRMIGTSFGSYTSRFANKIISRFGNVFRSRFK